MEAVDCTWNMPGNPVNGFYLAAIALRSAGVDQFELWVLPDALDLVRIGNHGPVRVGEKARRGIALITLGQRAVLLQPLLQAAIQNCHCLMPEEAQHPPQPGSISPAQRIIDNYLAFVRNPPIPQPLCERINIRQWVTAGVLSNRAGQISIKMRIDRTWDVAIAVVFESSLGVF